MIAEVMGAAGGYGLAGVRAHPPEPDGNGILALLRAKSAAYRAKADEIDREIEAFTENAKKKFL
jgi:hypothetical protein